MKAGLSFESYGEPSKISGLDYAGIDPFGPSNTSLWHDSVRSLTPLERPAALPAFADVVIAGAGLTGLWAAYYLNQLDPGLSIVVVEAKHVAFGASGRAGGWAIATLDGQASWLVGLDGRAAEASIQCVTDTLDDIERVLATEGINCGYHRGGMVRIAARDPSQASVLSKYKSAVSAEYGGRSPAKILDEVSALQITSMSGAFAGISFPHCAVVNPSKLAHGIARVLLSKGVQIFESCRALAWDGRTLTTDLGSITSNVLVPALEGYSGLFPQTNGGIIPVFSHVIATEPLSHALRASLGLSNREAFADCSRISTYGQITEDNRIVFGALASYPMNGRLDHFSPSWAQSQYRLAHQTLTRLWPQLSGTQITHAWSGALGVPRNFRPAIVEDKERRMIWAGGYTSRGIAASNLFGHTIAEMICGLDTPRTRCPWVLRATSVVSAFRKWEPEPLRWLAIASITAPGRLKERALYARLPAPMRQTLSKLTDLIPAAR